MRIPVGWRPRLGRLWRVGLAVLVTSDSIFMPRAAEPLDAPAGAADWVGSLIERAGAKPGRETGARRPVVVFKQNKVEVTGGSGTAREAFENQELVAGDQVRTFYRSQALVRGVAMLWGLDEKTRARVQADNELTSMNPREGRFFWKSLNPADPSALGFETPAGRIEPQGTEFFLQIDEATGETRVWVGDGAVTLSNERGALHLAAEHAGATDTSSAVGVMRPHQAPTNAPPGPAHVHPRHSVDAVFSGDPVFGRIAPPAGG